MKMSIKEKSGIKGLDKVIGGGLRKNSLLLVIGGPGTGKSIMGMHYVEETLNKGNTAAYFTFELNKKIILEQANAMKININKYVENNKLILKEYDMRKISMTDVFKDMKEIMKKYKPDRMVIDSLSVISMYAEITAGIEVVKALDIHPKHLYVSHDVLRRGAIIGLINMLKSMDTSAFIIAEMPDGHHYLTRDSFSEFLADAVIKLTKVEATGKRYLTIVKMRTAGHDLIPHKMEITNKGIVVK